MLNPQERIKAKLLALHVPEPNTGCWLWLGAHDKDGYGKVSASREISGRAHRFSWEIFKGEIPGGKWVLHKCDTSACINPEHLFLGSARDNNLDMVFKKRHVNTRKTKCNKGHMFSPDNLVNLSKGRQERICKICAREKTRARLAAKKSLQNFLD